MSNERLNATIKSLARQYSAREVIKALEEFCQEKSYGSPTDEFAHLWMQRSTELGKVNENWCKNTYLKTGA